MEIIRDSVLFLSNTGTDGELFSCYCLGIRGLRRMRGKVGGLLFLSGVFHVILIGQHGVEAKPGEAVAHRRVGGLLGRGEP